MKSGNPDASRKTDRNELGLRDRRILADVIRFRLTTNEFIHSQHLGHAQANAVVKITGRLVRQGWLIAFQLFERQQYFVPGPSSIKLYGLPASRSRPLGPQSLASCYSVMKYCITTEAVLLANDELLTSLFPWMDGKLLTNPQVVEIAERVSTLRLIRVDLGGTPEHVAKKCLHDVKVRQSKAEFNQLVADSRFVLVVLTPTDSKQEQVKKAISKWKWPNGMRFQVFVVPELVQFLASK